MLRVGYARVSTGKQEKLGYSLEHQKSRLIDYGIEEGYIYSEAKSAKDLEGRPQFQKIMEMVRAGEVSEVIAIHPDRIARDVIDWLQILRDCSEMKVKITTLENPSDWDVSNSNNFLNTLLTGGMTNVELMRIKERNGKAWERRKKEKTALNPPFGYQLVKRNGNLVYTLNKTPFLCLLSQKVDNCEGMTVADIAQDTIDTFLRVKSLRGTTKEINLKYYGGQHSNEWKFYRTFYAWSIRFSDAGLGKWLQDPVLQGHTAYKRKHNLDNPDAWDVKKYTHPDDILVNEEQLKQIKEILEGNKRSQKYTLFVRRNPLSGLVICADCKSTCLFQATKHSNKHEWQMHYYYSCRNAGNKSCPNVKFIRIEKIYKAIYEAIAQQYSNLLESDRTKERIEQLESGEEEIFGRQNELREKLTSLEYFSTKFGSSLHIDKEMESITRELEHIEAHFERLKMLKGNNKQQMRDLYMKVAERLDQLLEGKEFVDVYKGDGDTLLQHLKDIDERIRTLIYQVVIKDATVIGVEMSFGNPNKQIRLDDDARRFFRHSL